jgi:hypothetical protein
MCSAGFQTGCSAGFQARAGKIIGTKTSLLYCITKHKGRPQRRPSCFGGFYAIGNPPPEQ